MSAARTERLLNLLTLLLNTKRPISLREIRDYEEFNAYETADPKSGERAFERDKASLLELGVPLKWISPEIDDSMDGLGGYIIEKDKYFMPELDLTPGEIATLSIASSAAMHLKYFPGKEAMVRAMAKLGFEDDPEGEYAAFSYNPMSEHESLMIEKCEQALTARHSVSFDYSGFSARQHSNVSGDKPSKQKALLEGRIVDPYGLYNKQGAWYLVGKCHRKQAIRTFHCGRISDLHLVSHAKKGKKLYGIPSSFSIKDYASTRPWEFPTHDFYEATIKVNNELMAAQSEMFGNKGEVISEEEFYSLIKLKVGNEIGLIQHLIPYGAKIEILEPQPLRDKMKKSLTQIMSTHQ